MELGNNPCLTLASRGWHLVERVRNKPFYEAQTLLSASQRNESQVGKVRCLAGMVIDIAELFVRPCLAIGVFWLNGNLTLVGVGYLLCVLALSLLTLEDAHPKINDGIGKRLSLRGNLLL